MDSRLQLENSVNNIGKTTTVEDSKNKTGYLPASTTSSRPRWVECGAGATRGESKPPDRQRALGISGQSQCPGLQGRAPVPAAGYRVSRCGLVEAPGAHGPSAGCSVL